MKSRSKLRVGLVGVYRPLFKGDKLGAFRETGKALKELEGRFGFDLCHLARPVSNLQEAEAAAGAAGAAGLDLLLIQMSSFCGGEALRPFCDWRGPLGLWALPEPSCSGPLPLNSLCGLNLYASILGGRPEGPKFKWFYGLPSDEMFASRFHVTVQALRARKALAEAKVGLIGGHAPGFDNLAVDGKAVAARLGVRVVEHTVEDLLGEAKKVSVRDAVALTKEMRGRSRVCTAPDAHVTEVARFEIALRRMAERGEYDGLAVRCWPEVPDRAGVMICAAMGGLADVLPTACEGDVLGAASMIALKAMRTGSESDSPPMLVDLSHVDETDQSVLMWHCGNSPACWADENGTRLECHFNRDTMGVVRSMVFRAAPATVFQLSGSGATALAFAGRFLSGSKPSFDGSRGWLGGLKMDGAPITVRDLLNTIFGHRLPHHYPIGMGDLLDPVNELCEWLQIERVHVLPYGAAMQTPKRGS